MRPSLIDPNMTNTPIPRPLWKHQKTKGPPAFPGGHKTRRSARKWSSDKIKTIESKTYCKKKMKNKTK